MIRLGLLVTIIMAGLTLFAEQGPTDLTLRGIYPFRPEPTDPYPFFYTKVNPVGVGVGEISGNGDQAEFVVLGIWCPRIYSAVPTETQGPIVIPNKLDGLPVRKIMDRAFFQCRGITSVSIPASVREIGENAFTCCEKLKKVTIAEGVETIGAFAFSNCVSLTSITLPASLRRIGPMCFDNCSNLESVYFKGNAPLLDPTLDPERSYFGERREWRGGIAFGITLPRFKVYAHANTIGWKGPYQQGLPEKWPMDYGWMAAHDILPWTESKGTVVKLAETK